MRFVSLALAMLPLLACKEPPKETPKAPKAPQEIKWSKNKPKAQLAVPKKTTSPKIALQNLDAQLTRAKMMLTRMPKELSARAQTVEILMLKVQLLGQVDVLDEIVALTKDVVDKEKPTAKMYLLRSRALGARHLFDEALADLAEAEKLGAPKATVQMRRQALLVTQGKASEALAGTQASVEKVPSFVTYSRLGLTLSALGDFQAADEAFDKAQRYYRDVSPFPVAWVNFQRGVMWAERAGDEKKGKRFYEQALERLPSYTTANVHLAELEAEAGLIAPAVERLKRAMETSSDPEPMALLGELYMKQDKKTEGEALIQKAKHRYDSLLKNHPAAFADHGAEFFMGPGKDAKRALKLAEENLSHRVTERALSLAIRAAMLAKNKRAACKWAQKAKAIKMTGIELKGVLKTGLASCS